MEQKTIIKFSKALLTLCFIFIFNLNMFSQQLSTYEKKRYDLADKTLTAMIEEDPVMAKEFLTNYTEMTAQCAVDAWKKLGEYLIVKYNDGVVKKTNADGSIMRPKYEHSHNAPLVRPGYPKEFLEAVVKATGDRYKVY